jgi:hypothetical protein
LTSETPQSWEIDEPWDGVTERRIHTPAVFEDKTFCSYCDCSIVFDPMFTEGIDRRKRSEGGGNS